MRRIGAIVWYAGLFLAVGYFFRYRFTHPAMTETQLTIILWPQIVVAFLWGAAGLLFDFQRWRKS